MATAAGAASPPYVPVVARGRLLDRRQAFYAAAETRKGSGNVAVDGSYNGKIVRSKTSESAWRGDPREGQSTRWRSFQAFLSDLGPRPSPAYTLGRRDHALPYEPSNVGWATRRQQASPLQAEL